MQTVFTPADYLVISLAWWQICAMVCAGNGSVINCCLRKVRLRNGVLQNCMRDSSTAGKPSFGHRVFRNLEQRCLLWSRQVMCAIVWRKHKLNWIELWLPQTAGLEESLYNNLWFRTYRVCLLAYYLVISLAWWQICAMVCAGNGSVINCCLRKVRLRNGVLQNCMRDSPQQVSLILVIGCSGI